MDKKKNKKMKVELEKESGFSQTAIAEEVISEKEKEELFKAVTDGKIELVEKIIRQKNVDINKINQGRNKHTLMHVAAERNNLEMLSLLVEVYEGDVNAKNKYNWSVLHSVASGIVNFINCEIEGGDGWEVMKWILQREELDINAIADNGYKVRNVFIKVDYDLAEEYDKLVKEFFLREQKKIEVVR